MSYSDWYPIFYTSTEDDWEPALESVIPKAEECDEYAVAAAHTRLIDISLCNEGCPAIVAVEFDAEVTGEHWCRACGRDAPIGRECIWKGYQKKWPDIGRTPHA